MKTSAKFLTPKISMATVAALTLMLSASNVVKAQEAVDENGELLPYNMFDHYINKGNQDFLVSIFYWLNIFTYLFYCNFIASITFNFDEFNQSDRFNEYRDTCLGGAFYELQMANSKGAPTEVVNEEPTED
uniref:Uncharacterized protein n=1 Tax=Strombidium rassoulzadegani TaxID=1082188 RepID=A0A7S3FV89_9SPIT|mmetsp:Transcript_17979/g.30597  ORF Transcript_17979/g.30597 Transcript_17979/m.30597 type:complete len:131 (+) Transcript_17979:28-420(+)